METVNIGVLSVKCAWWVHLHCPIGITLEAEG